MLKPVIIALDFPDKKEVRQFLHPFGDQPVWLKVGMELFYKEGPELVRELKAAGHSIFLDLKLHDIPTTVQRAMRQISGLDVDLVTIHTAGGTEMMKAAVAGLEEGASGVRPRCVGVTVLTSTNEHMLQTQLGWQGTVKEAVHHFAKSANESGLDGIVCSAHEAADIRQTFGPDFWSVTPGIRLAGDAANDQKRVMTPAEAREAGSTAIVVGRSITKKAQPYDVYQSIVREWESA
ncbi:orotidine-5'-phosphate decarboxylase [Aureibacillus halotolerans]|uniref:Orotidine 5'-phosphate decarboxylase n=1 Tax=Aureibacillus halotolerans TaxID=1508390 RepID=A0A4R6U960_9BACI|nr:orotidine-5'-phosphate decarboxylase [Aureibacillus halotolerans]TDQ42356.1 orotidine-5'-phosphate decarboxylase [Aureibacillus halotolerans]